MPATPMPADIPAAPTATETAATAPPAPPRVVIVCNDCNARPIPQIHFSYASAVIPADAEIVLREVVETMKAHPEIKVVAIEGHADLDEGKRITSDISRRRAEAVRDRLIAKGVAPARLVVEANGSAKPLDNNATIAGRARNRRVQFHVVASDPP
jgi:outer membrane protein OmpA-like peptidoglycan-associated protein